MTAELNNARVESYAGYRGEETPRAVVLEGERFAVMRVTSRKRVFDRASGKTSEIWRCRLAAGREVEVERLENGAWRVSART